MNPDVARNLHPPRLPESFVGLTVADGLLALGLGLALAGVVLALLRPALRRRPRRISLRAEIAQARALPPGEAMQALAALARRRGIALSAQEEAAVYAQDPGAMLDTLAARLGARQPGEGR